MMIKVLLSSISLILIIVILETRCEAKNIDEDLLKGFDRIIKNDDKEEPGSYCKCTDESCECCSIIGHSKMCNEIKLINIGRGQDPALELSIHIGKSKIFSQNVALRELEPICYPYENYNLCVQVDLVKNQQENEKVCGHFLAKQKAYDKVEESTLLKTQIFCLPFETRQLNKHVLKLLRFVSQ